jgi:hypothetical protein
MYFAHLMNINLLKEEFISGIYNYCDRWCERCTFTSRCESFNKSGKLFPAQSGINNNAFWEQISTSLEDAITLLHEAAKKQGIELRISMSVEEEAVDQQKQLVFKTALAQHTISILCKQYQIIARPFAEKSEGFADKTRELAADLRLGISGEKETVDTIGTIGDCLDIIKWYLFFIDAKLQRAMHSRLQTGEQEDEDDYQNDSNGSAKIALKAIEKSMGAWSVIYSLMPLSEDVALNSLALLEQLSSKIVEEFPGSVKFIRPGFDD